MNSKNWLLTVKWFLSLLKNFLFKISMRGNPLTVKRLPFQIQINPSSDWSKPNFQSELIRMNPRSEWFGLILIENSVLINSSSDWFGLIWIENLVSDSFRFIRIDVSELIGSSRIDFWPFFIKRDTKRFSDWFGMIHIGSNTDIGMNRNSSDWLGMNFNPILSPGNVAE